MKVVALDLVAVVATQVPQLGPRLDAFGDYSQVEALTHLDGCHDDGVLVWDVGDFAGEADVDLELVDRKPAQVGKAGVTRPEVVDGDLEWWS